MKVESTYFHNIYSFHEPLQQSFCYKGKKRKQEKEGPKNKRGRDDTTAAQLYGYGCVAVFPITEFECKELNLCIPVTLLVTQNYHYKIGDAVCLTETSHLEELILEWVSNFDHIFKLLVRIFPKEFLILGNNVLEQSFTRLDVSLSMALHRIDHDMLSFHLHGFLDN